MVETLALTTGQAKMKPGTGLLEGLAGGAPLTETKRAVEEGLNLMSETVRGGPPGGVDWLIAGARERRDLSRRVRPLVLSTEKQATPDFAPPLRTQAGNSRLIFALDTQYESLTYQC